MNPITSFSSSTVRIWMLHPNDPPFIWYHDLGLSYLLTTLIDTVWKNIQDISVNYCLFTQTCIEKFETELPWYQEEYFIFFMEDFFHSADYAYGFVQRILESMEKQCIHKKIIIYSHKTEQSVAMKMMEKFGDILVFIHDDIEYFFSALFWSDTSISDIPNLLWRNSTHSTINQSSEVSIVDVDIGTYIKGAYHNWYYMHFAKSKDTTIHLLDEDDEHKSIHLEMFQPKKYLIEVIRWAQERIMLSTWRGCKYKCAYCYRWAKYSNIRQIPLDVIEQDLAYIQKMWYTEVVLYDDCFLTTNSDRLMEILHIMKQYALVYHIAVRFEMCSTERLNLLADVGIASIQIGLQAVSIDANKISKRGFHEGAFSKVIASLQAKGIRISIDTILGLPDDSIWWFINTIKFAMSLQPGAIVVNTLYLNPRTELHRDKDLYQIQTRKSRWVLQYFKTEMILSSKDFTESDIQFCRKFLIQCQKDIHSIRFIIR
jgi:biotin synthase-like enzyme